MPLRQYAPGVYGWSRFQPERGYEFNGTALVSNDGTVLLVDPIACTADERTALQGLGKRFALVLLNADHERDSAVFRDQFNAEVFVPRSDAGLLKVAGATPYDSGHTFPGGWTAHTFSGLKTPGESVLHHAGRKMLVVGDALIADPLTGLRFVPPAKLPNRAAAMASIRELAALDFDGAYFGDGFVLPVGGREAIRRFLAKE